MSNKTYNKKRDLDQDFSKKRKKPRMDEKRDPLRKNKKYYIKNEFNNEYS